MSSKLESIGNIATPVGTYDKGNNEIGKRWRTIGEAFKRDDGSFTLKLNCEHLSPSLLIMLSKNGIIEKGEDSIFLGVFPKDDGDKKQTRQQTAPDESSPY